MTLPNYDVAVLGAGAAGLMAGVFAARRGLRVVVIERNRKPGVKILMSGGTRCNITHDCDNRAIVTAFGPNGSFLYSALARLGPREAREFFHDAGVPSKVEETGKIFPISDKAIDVANALVRELQSAGGVLALDESVIDLDRAGEHFIVQTAKRAIHVPQVILTTGGLSYPGCGTRGDGYAWAKKFGHSIIDTRPALTPLSAREPWVKGLQGLTLADASVTVRHEQKKLSHHRGGLLFAHFGLSGPTSLNVSKAVSRHEQPKLLKAELDFVPQMAEPDFDKWLAAESLAQGRSLLANVLAEAVPRRLADTLLARASIAPDRKATGLTRPERLALVAAVKRSQAVLDGTLGYEKAEVTSGGVNLREVDSKTMRSRLVKGLFFAGEILDLDGPIGGYNFQAAWSTGALAASALSEREHRFHRLKKDRHRFQKFKKFRNLCRSFFNL